MKIFQKEITLSEKPRGFHIITNEIVVLCPFIAEINIGLFTACIKHTSASLSINENADPTVRGDLEKHFNKMVPEDESFYTHITEGSDDMPAHIKAVLLGTSIQIPITKGKLNLGRWQGIFLCEHRNQAGERNLVLTAYGK